MKDYSKFANEVYRESEDFKREQEISRYKSSLLISLPVSPEQATKQYQLSKQTGIPVGIVRSRENEIAKRTELATFEDEDFINNFPKVVSQLSNPDIAGAIKDDVDSLSKFEKISRSSKEKFEQSALQDETVDLRIKRMFSATGSQKDKLRPSEEAFIEEFERTQPKDYGLGFISNIIPETIGATRTIYGVAKEAGPAALAGTGIGAAIGATIGALSPTKAIPQFAGAGARTGLKVSSAGGSALAMAKLEAAGAGDELRNIVDENGKPLEPEVVVGAALLTGAVNGAIEMIPVKVGFEAVQKAFSKEGVRQLVKSKIAREYLKNIGKGAVVEGSTEALQSMVNIVVAESAKIASDGEYKPFGMKDINDIEGFGKFVAEKVPQVIEEGLAGAAAGVGLSAIGGGVIASKRIYDNKKKNEREKQVISEINQVASQSKVLKRDPELFKETTKDTLGEVNYYIPAEQIQTYFQDKPDSFQKFLEIPQVKEQLNEALEIGGNVIIPSNEFIVNAVNNPDINGLENFIKLSPESLNELEAQDEFLTRAVPEMVATEQEAINNRERNEIKQNIRKQITNIIPTKEQEDYIALLENYYDTRAKRYGNETAKKILETYLGQLEINQKKFQKPVSRLSRIEDLDLMIDKARKPIKQPKVTKPLLKSLKELGGVRIGSTLAGELNAIGINTKTAPALFKKNGGIGDVDNIPLSEFQSRFPNTQAIADETGNYVDRQFLLDLLRNEQFGEDITLTKSEEQKQIEDFLQGLDEAGIDINLSNEEIKKAIKDYQGYSQTKDQTAPTFYSALEKQITDLPQGKGSPEQWLGIIKNLIQKGVKQEELDWTGIEDWIKEQKGSVAKQQIIDYLAANKIEVEEFIKGVGEYKDITNILKESVTPLGDGFIKVWENGKTRIYQISKDEFQPFVIQGKQWANLDSVKTFKQAQKKIQKDAKDYIDLAKFSKYTLAGGENYRELLLTLPKVDEAGLAYDEAKSLALNNVEKAGERLNTQGYQPTAADYETYNAAQAAMDKIRSTPRPESNQYKSSHYDEKNILAHIRFNERTDAEGKRVMFVEELQSDWHQEGRKKGYKTEARDTSNWRAEMQPSGRWAIFDDNNQWMSNYTAETAEDAIKLASESRPDPRVPNAPFKTTWNELAFKRALLWAVENNFDKVAWTTGEQQAERYDLSKQVDSIAYAKSSDGKTVSLDVEKNGSNVFSRANISINELPDIVGKEITDKIVKGEYTDTNNLGYNVLSGLDLKVGGEGMKAFYDKIVPTMVNKLAKKFGGKVEDTKIDIDGKQEQVHSLEITPAMRESIQQQGLPLFQDKGIPFGQTQFIGQKPIITLFEKADRSTLLHELGHMFLQIEADVAKLPDMPSDFKKDWEVLEKWLGVKDGNITTEAHEKFARGFEAYLREGKAPSLELRSAFRRFKAWLLRIYKNVLNLNVKLNDNIRGYFDRLFAVDEQIEAQRNNPIFATDKNVLELLTTKEREDYIKISDNAKEKTKEELLKKAFKQSEVKNKKFYKEEFARVKEEIQEELNQDKTYKVLTFLKTGKIDGEEQLKKLKLSSKDIKDNYEGEFLKYLPKSILSKDGVNVDIIADEFGFKSGSEMLFAIANAPNYQERINELADQEMTRRYGDVLKDGTIEREALEMAENEARARKITYELNAINRKVKTITESKEAYKQKAKEIIEQKFLSEATDTNKYYVNGLKAAREAGKALGKKDYEKAVDWKKKQLLNHYLFRESKALREEVATSNRRYKRYAKKPSKGKVRIDEDFRGKIVSLLRDFSLISKPEDHEKTNIAELESWKKEKQDEGVLGLVEFPEIASFQNKSFNQLTVEEYRILDNAIENLAYIGEKERFIEVEGKKIEIANLANNISESIKSNLKEKPKIIGSKTKTEELADKFDQANSTLTKAKNIALKLDGDKALGIFYNSFIKPVSNQELVRNEMIKEASDKLNEIFNKYLKNLPKKRTLYEEVNAQLSRQNLVAIALNWGNNINKKRIKDGFGWTDQQVMSLLSNLTENELNYVQEIWDYLDSFWEPSSSLHKKLFGFSPKKQSFAPFKIKTVDGKEVSLRGGYYPIAYSQESKLGTEDLESYTNASINYEKSYLKERTDKKVDKDLTLTLIPLYTHISNVVNDLAMKEQTWNSDKILKNKKVQQAITSTAGINQYKELQSWLKDLFGVAKTTSGWFGSAINHLRAGMTISTMGLKLSTVIIQASGYAQSIVKIGYTPMLKGLFKFLGNGNLLKINQSMNEAMAKSKILKTRETTYHRDIFETFKTMEKKGKLPKNLVAYYFYPMAKMQMLVDIPTWYGAYYKGLKDFNGNDAKAVEYADLVVVQSQGSGLMQDLSSFERGSIGGQNKSDVIKMFTAFYTYFNAKWNLAQESYRKTNFRRPADIAKFASDMMLLYFVEAIVGEIILGKLPDFDDEDEDTFATYSTKLIASNFFAQFPISREAVSVAKGFEGTPSGFSGLAIATKGFTSAIKEPFEEEPDITKIIEGINQGSGIIFHYPSGQVDVFIDAIQKAQEGEDVAPINYLIRPKK